MMQTFLVDYVLIRNFQCLDNKRLGKQRVECLQILNTLEGKSKGWRHHPAVLMWTGYEDLLRYYMDFCILEWKRRGFKNSMALNHEWEKLPGLKDTNPSVWLSCKSGPFAHPQWWGDPRILNSHKANLYRKDPVWYGKFNWHPFSQTASDKWAQEPYYWPVTKEQVVLQDILQFAP
jgi:hypothetical protein